MPAGPELVLNLTKSEHLPIVYSPHFLTYTLPSNNPLNTHTNSNHHQYMGIVLNARLSTEDNVVSAANKARRMLYYLKRSFVALTPNIFLSLYKTLIRAHL